VSSLRGDLVEVTICERFVLSRRDYQYRATHAAECVTRCRSKQSPKGSALRDTEDDQIRIHFVGIPYDLVKHETDGDVDVHPPMEFLR